MISSMLTSFAAPTPAQAQPAARPEVEWWTVGADRFDSTAALLASPTAASSNQRATYHYFPTAAEATPQALAAAKASNARSAAIGSGVIGAIGGTVLLAAFGLTPGGLLAAAGLTAVCALAGGALSQSWSDVYAREGNAVSGTLSTGNTFQTASGNPVELAAWSRGDAPQSEWWRDTDIPAEAYVFHPY